MFRAHQKLISEYARQNPENFARVLKFVVLTIRNRLMNLPADMQTLDYVESGGNPEELGGMLYGFKQAAIEEINAEKESLFWQAESIVYHAQSEREAAENLIDLFSGIYGLGLAKAGFCAQLIYGVGGCLDSHNLARFGISPNVVKSSTFKNAKRLSTKRKWLARYCDLVEKFGGCESLWDSWCEYVYSQPDETGIKMNGNAPLYESAYHVSALHCLALGIDAPIKPLEEESSK